MDRTDAITWVVSVCAVGLRVSQAKTLAVLVASVMRGVVRRLTERRRKRMIVSFEWNEIRSFQTLVASAVPEPSSLLPVGISALALRHRRRVGR